jgi:hypothetical protein
MALENLLGSRTMSGLLANPRRVGPPGLAGGKVRVWNETVEVLATALSGSTYHLCRLPSNARILAASRISFDDMSADTTPKLDIGCFNPTGLSGFTDDQDALTVGLILSTATRATHVLSTIDIEGKRLFEMISGLSASPDPQQMIDIKGTITDAVASLGGTISLELYYSLD